MKKILITGGAGFIGSMLSTELINLGYKVTVIDKIKYSKNSLLHLLSNKNFTLIKKDIRAPKVLKEHMKNKDYIIPLAALVGAPLCAKYPKETREVNLGSIKTILKYIKKSQKIIYMNSNSGYGIGAKDKFCDENSPLNPISLYGRTKIAAEKEILKFKNSLSFRLATVFGLSYRMRTDLLVNFLVYETVKNKKITLFEPNFRRNFIHIKDVVDGIIFAINNFNKLKGNIYNLGLSNANITKLQLAKLIKKNYKPLKIKIITNRKDPDKRDYFVSNKKIEKKGFTAKRSLEFGIQELIKVYELKPLFEKNNY